MKKMVIVVAVAAATMLILSILTGCGSFGNKYSQPFKDAPRSGTNTAPAEIIEMPDGFSNAATKCIAPGIRITTLYHGNGIYGNVSTVQDPNCK